MRRFNRLCCLVALVTGSLNLFGQQGTSTMVGAVSDPADASIPNAALRSWSRPPGPFGPWSRRRRDCSGLSTCLPASTRSASRRPDSRYTS